MLSRNILNTISVLLLLLLRLLLLLLLLLLLINPRDTATGVRSDIIISTASESNKPCTYTQTLNPKP